MHSTFHVCASKGGGVQPNKYRAIYENAFALIVTVTGWLFTNEGVGTVKCGTIMQGIDLCK